MGAKPLKGSGIGHIRIAFPYTFYVYHQETFETGILLIPYFRFKCFLRIWWLRP